MKLKTTISLSLALLRSFLSSSAASSLRGERILKGERRYSTSTGGGGGAAGGAASKGKSPKREIPAPLTTAILGNSDPTPTHLVKDTGDAQFLGYAVSYAGDVNGDGIDDIIIGAPKKTFDDMHQRVGAAFVIFGQDNDGGLPNIASIDNLDGKNGFALYGNVINDDVGYSVSNAGDFNDDGFDDVIIGAPGVDGAGIAGSGHAYVVFGTDVGFQAVYNTWNLNGSNGFTIQGNSIQDYLGSSVSYAGDVNGDGIDDIIVGAPGTDNGGRYNGGEAYVIFGSGSGFPSFLFVADLNGSNGFTIESEGDQQFLGQAVGFAGDVNDDGIDDILLGATGTANENGVRTGATYVIFGSIATFDSSFQVSTVSGENGFKIYGTSNNDQFGRSVSALGDVNGDGIHDFIVGCPRCRPTGGEFYAGAAYIFYGGMDRDSFVDAATAGMIVASRDAFDGLGESVSFAGDVNGDGVADILVGSGRGNTDDNAIVYVIYGSTTDLTPSLAARDIDGSLEGIAIPIFDSSFAGKTHRTISVAFAGDFNNDGASDLIVGVPMVELVDETFEGHVKILLGN